MTLRVLLEVAENIQGVDFYVIMCIEATDVKNISEFVVCLRWVDNELEAYDNFIGLKNMPNTDADVQKAGLLYKSKAKRNVPYIPIAMHIKSILQ